MKYKVFIPYPTGTEYVIDAPYPEKARRIAADKHKHLIPGASISEIALMASCVKVDPQSAGGRPRRNRTFIESMFKKMYGS